MKTRPRTLILVAAVAGAAGTVAAPAREVPFAAPAGIGTASVVGDPELVDLDRDGDLDLVGLENVGLAGSARVLFLARDRSGAALDFDAHVVREVFGNITASDVGDLDRDGYPDVVMAYTSADDTLHLDWGSNDGTPADGGWSFHRIYSDSGGVLVDWIHPDDTLAADFDGDGDLDVALSYRSHETLGDPDGRILVFVNDGSPAGVDWDSYVLKDWIEFRNWFNLAAVDLDRDGHLDLLAYKGWEDWLTDFGELAWYRNDGSPANGPWAGVAIAAEEVAGGPLGACAALADFDRNGTLDVAAGQPELLADPALSWYLNDGTPAGPNWASHEVAAGGIPCTLSSDLDLDGDLDLVADWGSSDFFGDPGTTAWYDNDGTPAAGAWTSRSLGGGALEVDGVFDLDQDGDPDLLGGSRWQENLTIHRSALLRDERVLSSGAFDPWDIVAADLDRDGDLDLVTASAEDDDLAFYQNDGSPGDGGWGGYLVGSADQPRAVAAGDLDGDGDLDLVSASYGDDTVAWYENDGTPTAGWTKWTISNGAGGANDVVLGDFDHDGDLDIACAQYLHDEISWYRNNGASPPAFGAFFVDSAPYDGPRALAVGDLDGDGDLDLAAVSEDADRVVWYGNDGTPADGEWARHRTDNGESDAPKDVSLADLDRDGDLDTLVANYAGDDVLWYENDGTLAGWTARTITTCGGARAVAAGDFDRDGDEDVLVSCFDDDRVKLQRSNGASPPDLTTTLSSLSGADGARTVLAADLDRDGDLDGAVVQAGDDQVAWYENRGGQFRVVGTAIAVDPLASDAVQGLFRAVVVHRGSSADGWIELAAVAVRLEETAGDPLNAFQAAALIDQLRVYGDDGDGLFEPAADPLLAAGGAAGIDVNGVVWVDLADYLLGAAIPALSQRTYFVAVELASPFLAAAPETLRATILTAGDAVCEADDREHQIPLDLEWRADVSTATLALLDVIFRDAFESGDTAAWSVAAP